MLPQTYVELLDRAQKYIRIKEGATDRHQSESKGQKKTMKKEGTSAGSNRTHTEREALPFRSNSKPKNFGNRYDSCTSLTTLCAHILMEIEGESYLRRPQPMKSRSMSRNRKC